MRAETVARDADPRRRAARRGRSTDTAGRTPASVRTARTTARHASREAPLRSSSAFRYTVRPLPTRFTIARSASPTRSSGLPLLRPQRRLERLERRPAPRPAVRAPCPSPSTRTGPFVPRRRGDARPRRRRRQAEERVERSRLAPGDVLVEEAGRGVGEQDAAFLHETTDRGHLAVGERRRVRQDEDALPLERAVLDLRRREEPERQAQVVEQAHPAVAVRREARAALLRLLAVVLAQDAGRVDGRHRVVDGDAVVEPLRLHQQPADPLEAQGLERLARGRGPSARTSCRG